ncbi:MAG: hypothetical protein ABFE07_15865 [Armatimonadia bacterium]
MKTLLCAVCLLLCLACLAADLPNLAQNPGFEAKAASGLPEAWSGDTKVFSHVTTPAHTGQGALQFINMDASNYALCRQQLPLVPGKAYQASVWVKCEGVEGDDSGATLCLEWYTTDDKYLGGAYPGGIKGTRDWTQVKTVTGRVPATAAKCYVVCYLRKGMTGKAWWDDLEVKQWLEPALQTMLLKPNYRGIITPETKEIVLAADLMLDDYDLKPAQVELQADLVSRQDTKTVRTVKLTPRGTPATITMPADGLGVGKYQLQARLVTRADQKVIGTDAWRLEVPAEDLTKRAAYIDEHNRCIVNGKPFFPLGMYWSSINEPDMKVYSDSAFNCLMPYGFPSQEQMDLAQSNNLKVIYTLKDIYSGTTWAPKGINTPEDERAFMETKTRQFREHPALLAWYLNDELSIDHMPSLEAHQEWMEDLDPNHPTWIVLYQVNQLHLYRKTFDVLGTDPYPIPSKPAREAANYTIRSRESTMGSRPIWQVPQAMNWACYRKTEEEKKGLRMPTLDELRSMSWQCITEGATGLIYYSWFDLKKIPADFDRDWANTKQVAAEIKQYLPVLLSIEEPAKVTANKQEWLHWTTRKLGNATYLFAVNDEGEAHKATFKLAQTPQEIKLEGRTVAEKRGSALQADFAPFELKVYRLTF